MTHAELEERNMQKCVREKNDSENSYKKPENRPAVASPVEEARGEEQERWNWQTASGMTADPALG